MEKFDSLFAFCQSNEQISQKRFFQLGHIFQCASFSKNASTDKTERLVFSALILYILEEDETLLNWQGFEKDGQFFSILNIPIEKGWEISICQRLDAFVEQHPNSETKVYWESLKNLPQAKLFSAVFFCLLYLV